MDEQLLIRFLTHQCSAREVERIEQWIAQDEANAARLFEIERIWSLKDEFKYAEEKEWKPAYTQLVSYLEKKEAARKKKPYLWFKRVGYAALVLFGLCAAMLFLNREEEIVAMNIIEVPKGQRATLLLSDGTKVSLNAESRFAYPSDFSEKKRKVELSGEGYFEVTHQNGAPFIVSLPLLEIKVLGTTFNVKAYTDEDTEVTLEKGKVEVFVASSDDAQPANKLQLYPNQQLRCTPGKQVSLREVDPAISRSWLVGGFFFDNLPLGAMMKELERRFDVTIRIDDPQLARQVFTCHTKAGATLGDILDVLRNTQKMNYLQRENTYILFTPNTSLPMSK